MDIFFNLQPKLFLLNENFLLTFQYGCFSGFVFFEFFLNRSLFAASSASCGFSSVLDVLQVSALPMCGISSWISVMRFFTSLLGKMSRPVNCFSSFEEIVNFKTVETLIEDKEKI